MCSSPVASTEIGHTWRPKLVFVRSEGPARWFNFEELAMHNSSVSNEMLS